jgi:hypothetical protein
VIEVLDVVELVGHVLGHRDRPPVAGLRLGNKVIDPALELRGPVNLHRPSMHSSAYAFKGVSLVCGQAS